MRPRRAWTPDRGPGAHTNPPLGRTRIWTFMPARPCLTDHGSRRLRQSGQGRRVPSTTSGTSSAVSRRTAGVRKIASVRALMAREAVGRHTPRNSPITACTMFWRRYIEVARGDPDRPGIGGYPSTPSSRSRASSPSNSSSVARGALHGDGPLLPGSWGYFFYAHDTPRGWAIIISPPENDPRHPQNNLPGRGRRRTSRTAGKLFKGPPDLFSSPDPQHIDQEPDPRRIRCARPAVLRCASTHRKVRRGRARQRKYSRGHALPRRLFRGWF